MPGARRTRKGMVHREKNKPVGSVWLPDRDGDYGVQNQGTGAEQRGRGSYRVDGTPVDYAGPSVVIKSS